MSKTSQHNKKLKARAKERTDDPGVTPNPLSSVAARGVSAASTQPPSPPLPRFSSWQPGPDDDAGLRFWQSPRMGDIVETRFPDFLREQFGVKAIVKTRPCLVVGIEEFANGQTVVKVAYGTSHIEDRHDRGQTVEGIQPGELMVKADDKRTGLTADTKFSLRKVLELPFSTQYFSACPDLRYGLYPKRGKVELEAPDYRRAIDGAIREARELGSLLEVDGQSVRLKRDVVRGGFKR